MNSKALGLNGNQLKLIALAAMTADHIGLMLFPDVILLRVIGRLSFPIFAYMIAEGSKKTGNKIRHLLTVAGTALLCQIVYFVLLRSLYMCIMVTFTFSLVIIYAIDYARKRKKPFVWICTGFSVFAILFIAAVLHRKFGVDYGVVGIITPALIYAGRDKKEKLLLTALACLLLSLVYPWIQWFCFLAILFLALYNGRRGERNIKYLFYVYYPLHMALLSVLSFII